MANIKDIIRELAGTNGPQFHDIIEGTVTRVDKDNYVVDVTPLNDTADILNVSVSQDIGPGFTQWPKMGSYVAVGMTSRATGVVVMTSQLDSLELNGKDYDGLVIISKLVEKLNNLENDINNLKSTISSWSPVANDGGAALKLKLTTYLGKTLAVTQKSDLENTTVVHGSGS